MSGDYYQGKKKFFSCCCTGYSMTRIYHKKVVSEMGGIRQDHLHFFFEGPVEK